MFLWQTCHNIQKYYSRMPCAVSISQVLLLPPRRICNRPLSVFVCLLTMLHKNFRTDFHEIFREHWQWANEQMMKFQWRSRSPSGYRDCFPDSSLLGDTESGINRLCCTMLQCRACTSRHRHSNYDVIMSPAHDWYRDTGKTCLGRGMHCPSTSSLYMLCKLMITFNTDQHQY